MRRHASVWRGSSVMDRDKPAPVAVHVDATVGIIELVRPDKFNCLSSAAFAAIEAALDRFEQPASGVRSVLIRAQGPHFCTGADLDEVLLLRDDPPGLQQFISAAHHMMNRLATIELPVVAACQGLSLAGGIELMLACDVAFAAHDARFGDQHAQYGLLPGFGGSQRLPRTIGLRRALDLFYTARWLDAETALQWGLVNYVVDAANLHDQSLSYCHGLAQRSRSGLATMKRMALAGLDIPLAAGLAMEEATAVSGLLHHDAEEGLAAFDAHRAPIFGAD